MALPRRAEQEGEYRVVGVPRGLHVLRYVRSDAAMPPSVIVSPSADAQVEVIAPEPSQICMLKAPGEALVLRGLAEISSISLLVRPQTSLGSRDAELRLEPLSASASTRRGASIPVLQPIAAQVDDILIDTSNAGILAHVSRRGDVTARLQEWICGPDLPMVIEGLEFRWPDCPETLRLNALVEASMRGGLRPFSGGFNGFIGTRRKAAPLTTLAFSLDGAAASRCTLAVDALFLGAPVQSKRGQSVRFSGPSGREPLVGLRVNILVQGQKPAVSFAAADTRYASASANAIEPASASRVRVFRTLRKPTAVTSGLK
jgi:hypothetical protein